MRFVPAATRSPPRARKLTNAPRMVVSAEGTSGRRKPTLAISPLRYARSRTSARRSGRKLSSEGGDAGGVRAGVCPSSTGSCATGGQRGCVPRLGGYCRLGQRTWRRQPVITGRPPNRGSPRGARASARATSMTARRPPITTRRLPMALADRCVCVVCDAMLKLQTQPLTPERWPDLEAVSAPRAARRARLLVHVLPASGASPKPPAGTSPREASGAN